MIEDKEKNLDVIKAVEKAKAEADALMLKKITYYENEINELKNNYDHTKEITKTELSSLSNIFFTTEKSDLNLANHFIITVPTPIPRAVLVPKGH